MDFEVALKIITFRMEFYSKKHLRVDSLTKT